MRDNIYISTSAFKSKRIEDIVAICLKGGFTNLELGSNIDYSDGNLDLIFKYNGQMKFLLHNYFPRPKDDFVLNLASDNGKVLARSIKHCREAIDISAKIGAPFFSVHAGFAFHSSPGDLGRPQVGLPRIPYQKAYNTFIESVSGLVNYAVNQRVKLAIENNVVARFNLINGKNEVCLLVEAAEALDLYKEISHPNLYFLIDLGHLKINSLSLGIDVNDYLKQLLPHSIAFHLSDNTGEIDQHLPFDKNVWFGNIIGSMKDRFMIIETQSLEMSDIQDCYCSLIGLLGDENGQ